MFVRPLGEFVDTNVGGNNASVGEVCLICWLRFAAGSADGGSSVCRFPLPLGPFEMLSNWLRFRNRNAFAAETSAELDEGVAVRLPDAPVRLHSVLCMSPAR